MEEALRVFEELQEINEELYQILRRKIARHGHSDPYVVQAQNDP